MKEMKVLVVAVILFAYCVWHLDASDNHVKSYITVHKAGRQKIPVSVTVDVESQTVFSRPVSESRSVLETLHDFRNNFAAHRSADDNSCYLETLELLSLDDEIELLEKVKGILIREPPKTLFVSNLTLTSEEILSVGGVSLERFCKGRSVHRLIVPDSKDQYAGPTRSKRSTDHYGSKPIRRRFQGKVQAHASPSADGVPGPEAYAIASQDAAVAKVGGGSGYAQANSHVTSETEYEHGSAYRQMSASSSMSKSGSSLRGSTAASLASDQASSHEKAAPHFGSFPTTGGGHFQGFSSQEFFSSPLRSTHGTGSLGGKQISSSSYSSFSSGSLAGHSGFDLKDHENPLSSFFSSASKGLKVPKDPIPQDAIVTQTPGSPYKTYQWKVKHPNGYQVTHWYTGPVGPDNRPASIEGPLETSPLDLNVPNLVGSQRTIAGGFATGGSDLRTVGIGVGQGDFFAQRAHDDAKSLFSTLAEQHSKLFAEQTSDEQVAPGHRRVAPGQVPEPAHVAQPATHGQPTTAPLCSSCTERELSGQRVQITHPAAGYTPRTGNEYERPQPAVPQEPNEALLQRRAEEERRRQLQIEEHRQYYLQQERSGQNQYPRTRPTTVVQEESVRPVQDQQTLVQQRQEEERRRQLHLEEHRQYLLHQERLGQNQQPRIRPTTPAQEPVRAVQGQETSVQQRQEEERRRQLQMEEHRQNLLHQERLGHSQHPRTRPTTPAQEPVRPAQDQQASLQQSQEEERRRQLQIEEHRQYLLHQERLGQNEHPRIRPTTPVQEPVVRPAQDQQASLQQRQEEERRRQLQIEEHRQYLLHQERSGHSGHPRTRPTTGEQEKAVSSVQEQQTLVQQTAYRPGPDEQPSRPQILPSRQPEDARVNGQAQVVQSQFTQFHATRLETGSGHQSLPNTEDRHPDRTQPSLAHVQQEAHRVHYEQQRTHNTQADTQPLQDESTRQMSLNDKMLMGQREDSLNTMLHIMEPRLPSGDRTVQQEQSTVSHGVHSQGEIQRRPVFEGSRQVQGSSQTVFEAHSVHESNIPASDQGHFASESHTSTTGEGFQVDNPLNTDHNPRGQIRVTQVQAAHEASVGRVGDNEEQQRAVNQEARAWEIRQLEIRRREQEIERARHEEMLRQQRWEREQELLRRQEAEQQHQEMLRLQEEEKQRLELQRQEEERERQHQELLQQQELERQEALKQQEKQRRLQELLRQEELKRQEVLRQQEQERQRQEALRQQEQERQRQEMIRQQELERQRQEKLRQEELERQRQEKLRQEELERQRQELLREQELERQRQEKLRQEALERQRQELLRQQQIEQQRREQLRQQHIEHQRQEALRRQQQEQELQQQKEERLRHELAYRQESQQVQQTQAGHVSRGQLIPSGRADIPPEQDQEGPRIVTPDTTPAPRKPSPRPVVVPVTTSTTAKPEETPSDEDEYDFSSEDKNDESYEKPCNGQNGDGGCGFSLTGSSSIISQVQGPVLVPAGHDHQGTSTGQRRIVKYYQSSRTVSSAGMAPGSLTPISSPITSSSSQCSSYGYTCKIVYGPYESKKICTPAPPKPCCSSCA